MTYARALIIAFLTAILIRSDGEVLEMIVPVILGGCLWWAAPDPLPDAVDRGLEAFARKYRR